MTFPVEWMELLLAWGIMAMGALLQGCVGFGYALVAGPLLILLGPHWVPGPLILGAVFLTVSTWHREWRITDLPGKKRVYREVAWAVAGRIPGVVVGAGALLLVPVERMGLLVGGMVLLAVALSLVSRPFHPDPPGLLVAGFVSGFMGTTAAVGGPPLALLYQWQPPPRIRVTLAVYFTFGALLSILGLLAVERFGWRELWLGLGVAPGTQLGFALSGPLLARLEHKNLRPMVLLLAAISALAALGHGYFVPQ